MTARDVIQVEGIGHAGQPIPVAVRRGPLLVTSNISGRSRTTNEPPADARDEIATAFDNLRAVLSAASLDLDAVVKVEAKLSSLELRGQLNEVWLELFPNADDRPVRMTTQESLPGGLRIQLAVTAYR
jgi:2-iminobutanoate/2-iminopropanoate deaminase